MNAFDAIVVLGIYLFGVLSGAAMMYYIGHVVITTAKPLYEKAMKSLVDGEKP